MSAEDQEDSKGPFLVYPGTCGCPDHYAWDLMKIDLRTTPKKLFNEVFGEHHYLWTTVHKKTGTNGLFIGNWIQESGYWKRNLVYSSLIKIPNRIFFKCSQETVQNSHKIVNGEPVFCMESQSLRKFEHAKTLIIDSKIKIQKAAFLEPFNILIRYCIFNIDGRSCTFLMTGEVQYSKKGQSKRKFFLDIINKYTS
jgi:hypothetical protein